MLSFIKRVAVVISVSMLLTIAFNYKVAAADDPDKWDCPPGRWDNDGVTTSFVSHNTFGGAWCRPTESRLCDYLFGDGSTTMVTDGTNHVRCNSQNWGHLGEDITSCQELLDAFDAGVIEYIYIRSSGQPYKINPTGRNCQTRNIGGSDVTFFALFARATEGETLRRGNPFEDRDTNGFCEIGQIYLTNGVWGDARCFDSNETFIENGQEFCYLGVSSYFNEFRIIDTDDDLRVEFQEAFSAGKIGTPDGSGGCDIVTAPGVTVLPTPTDSVPVPDNSCEAACGLLRDDGLDSQADECDACCDRNTGKADESFHYTAIGCVDASRDALITRVFQIGIGLIGGFATWKVMLASYKLQGKSPDEHAEAREEFLSAFFAIMLMVGAIVILRYIGLNVLGLFGLDFFG